MTESTNNEDISLSAAFLAGQASADHEWEIEYGKLFDEAVEWRDKCVELDKEVDLLKHAPQIVEALKAQVGEPCSVCKGRGVVTVLHHTRDRTEIPCSACTHPTTEPVKAQAGEQLPKDMEKVLHDNLWELYERSPTTERRVIPEDVRKVMEMALEALGYARDYINGELLAKREAYGNRLLHRQESIERDLTMCDNTITALCNALNAAPAPTKD